MLQNLIPIVSQINPKLLILLGCIFVVLVVISLFKKALKAALVLVLFALIFFLGIPAVQQVKANYGISYNKITEDLKVKVKGEVFSLPLKEIKEAKAYKVSCEKGNSTTHISITYQRKDDTSCFHMMRDIAVPNYMLNPILKFMEKYNIKYTVTENVL